MPDREKAIKALENARRSTLDAGIDRVIVTHEALDSILDLLKEQQKLIDEITQRRANNGAFD